MVFCSVEGVEARRRLWRCSVHTAPTTMHPWSSIQISNWEIQRVRNCQSLITCSLRCGLQERTKISHLSKEGNLSLSATKENALPQTFHLQKHKLCCWPAGTDSQGQLLTPALLTGSSINSHRMGTVFTQWRTGATTRCRENHTCWYWLRCPYSCFSFLGLTSRDRSLTHCSARAARQPQPSDLSNTTPPSLQTTKNHKWELPSHQ